MSIDRRKHVRHEVNYSCWFAPAGAPQLIEGHVRNISAVGAKVECRSLTDVPDVLDLYMTRDGKAAAARSSGDPKTQSG